jgi:hypothetical protein
VLRGTSIGTLAAATLLEAGAQPGAVVLVAPVRGETIARNYLYDKWWDPAAFVVSLFFAPAVRVDIVETLRETKAPLLVYFPARDDYLPEKEALRVTEAVAAAHGEIATRRGTGHFGMVLQGFHVLLEERLLYGRLFRDTPPFALRRAAVLAAVPEAVAALLREEPASAALDALVRTRRIDPPALAAALVLEPEPDDARARLRLGWLRRLDEERLARLPFDALRALVSFDDPAGALDPRELGGMAAELAGVERSPERIVRVARERGLDHRSRFAAPLPDGWNDLAAIAVMTVSIDTDTGAQHVDQPARLSLPREQSLRQAARLLLKAAGIPDRCTDEGHLEAFWNNTWTSLSH